MTIASGLNAGIHSAEGSRGVVAAKHILAARAGDETIGTLNAYSTKPDAFDVDDQAVGHVLARHAAVALGNLYFFGCAILGMGALMGLDPVVAQALGAGDRPAVARGVQRGLLLAVLISVPGAVALMYAEPVLRALSQPAEVV